MISFLATNVGVSILTIPSIAIFVIPFMLIIGQWFSLADGDLIAFLCYAR